MLISVRLFGPFRIDRFKEQRLDCPPGATVQVVVEQLRIPLPLLGTSLVNGLHADLDAPLAEGDELTILPFLEGG